MTDELALHKDVDRAAKAKALLENELLVEALARLEADYITVWKASGPRDAEGRELTWLALKALESLKINLQSVVTNGRMAQAELDKLTQS